MKTVLSCLIIMLFFFGCANDDDSSVVKIRIANISPYDFQNIIVSSTAFEDTKSGQKSVYKVFEFAYRYAFIELDIEGNTYTIQPIDFVGETQLKNGNYTYQLDANDSQERYGKLSLIFVED